MAKSFKNLSDFKEYIVEKTTNVVSDVQDRVGEDFHKSISDFYKEYTPIMYVRTKQLYNTVYFGDIHKHRNGAWTWVEFNPDELDYSTRIIPNKLHGTNASSDNFWYDDGYRRPWTHEDDIWVFETAMEGVRPHGDYAVGTPIWFNAYANVDYKIHKYFYDELNYHIGVKKE